ncbi:MAG: hypothetical protein JWL77_4233, partial [Chthonomonadaceae bacterium]|nr:hypothetical protein [Chthonomonadaceae bacterium]
LLNEAGANPYFSQEGAVLSLPSIA